MSYSSESVTMTAVFDNSSSDRIAPQHVTSSEIPPGYSLAHTVLIAILVTVIMIVIVFGNLLIVVAIATDRQLKTIQNWFIASLAVADLSLGIIIMPFSLANELMRYWYFGSVWCDLWKAIDVLLCTASILSICLISLDRYWSITRALTYSRQRTPRRAALMITAVWVLSAIVCVPPLIGWKNPLPVSKYPLCLLSSEIGYVISSCMGSFYIPAVIMVFVYFKIYQAAKKRARRGRKTKNVKQEEMTVGNSSSDISKAKADSPKNEKLDKQGIENKRQITSNRSPDKTKQLKNLCVYDDKDETSSTSLLIEKNRSEGRSSLTPKIEIHQHIETTDALGHDVVMEQKYLLQHCTNGKINNELTKNTQLDNNKLSSSCAYYKNDISKNKRKIRKTKNKKKFPLKNSLYDIPNLNDIEKHKRKLAKARERRATIVLGLVMAAFIFCWFPFFTIYIVTSLCNFCIPEIIFNVAFWSGYCNSALNPIIYTIFNQDFRKAFHKIIFKKCSV